MSTSDKNSLNRTNNTAINEFLGEVTNTPIKTTNKINGRLLFAMDATASREPSWDMACQIQGEMFDTSNKTGSLSVQLAYYRGYNEFYASPWHNNASTLLSTMSEVRCLGGMTQIEKVLKQALAETKKTKINAVVFIGDAMEENIDILCDLAAQLGILGVPVFIFQENADPIVTMAFKQIAKLSHGVYCSFSSGSAQQLKDLLSAVAVYATGGYNALENFSKQRRGVTLMLNNHIRK